jgi:hypothetical protein
MEKPVHIFDLWADMNVELSEVEQARSFLLRERVAEETKAINGPRERAAAGWRATNKEV